MSTHTDSRNNGTNRPDRVSTGDMPDTTTPTAPYAGPFAFTPAVKGVEGARIALIGPPGSGKSFTALSLATAMGERVGVIDTDRRKARLYAGDFTFHHLPMVRFDPRDLTRAVVAAEDQGIDVLVLDTWSPFWSGQEGMLEQVDKATASANSRDKFGVGWNIMRPVERESLDALFNYPGHLIVTVRTKVEYVVEPGPDGKVRPRKVGTKPDQRDGVEYDFDVVADMGDATATITKTRCPALTGQVFHHPGRDLADTITEWLGAGTTGGRFSARDVLAWARTAGRTRGEVATRYAELDHQGYLGAMVSGLDGEPVSLGKALWHLGMELKRAEESATRQHGRAAS